MALASFSSQKHKIASENDTTLTNALKDDLHKALSEIIRAKSDAEALNYANKFAKEMMQTFF